MKDEENRDERLRSGGAKKRRSEQSYLAILESALAILAQKGYGALTIESIAATAKVSKQTIYRWWPSKAAIVLEALLAHAREQVPVPDTGSVRGDLEILLEATLDELDRQSGPIVRGLMAEAQFDPEFGRAFREDFIARRRQVVIEVLRRGQQRGEIGDRVDLELTVDFFYGPIWYRLLNQHAPLDRSFAQQLLERLLTGLH